MERDRAMPPPKYDSRCLLITINSRQRIQDACQREAYNRCMVSLILIHYNFLPTNAFFTGFDQSSLVSVFSLLFMVHMALQTCIFGTLRVHVF